MNRYLNLATFAVLIWFTTAFLPWVRVIDPHSEAAADLGSLTGSELTALSLLIPAITLLISVMSRYQRLRLVLVPAAALLSIIGIWMIYVADFGSYPAVAERIAVSTGQGSIAGFQIENQVGVLTFMVAGALTAALLAASAFQRSNKTRQATVGQEPQSSTQDLWDLQ